MKLKIQIIATVSLLLALSTGATAEDKKAGSAQMAREAVQALKTGSPAEKALACKRLAVYGQSDAVPALAPLLEDEQLAAWARTALEAIPGRAVDKALRQAMEKVRGNLLVGVINSIGVRGDTKAISPLSARLKESDVEIASAAAIALGRIGGDKATKALKVALAEAPLGLRSAAAQGCILCAEQLTTKKKYNEAVALYDLVRSANVPRTRLLEATRGSIIARRGDGIPLLLETLRSPDKGLFGIGLRTSRELTGTKVTEALVAELGRTPSERQGQVLAAIADRNDTVGVPIVIASAKSGAKNLRLVAIESMARSGIVAGVPVLLDAVTESDAEIADAAKTTLGSLLADEVNAPLLARLPQSTGNARRAYVKLAGERQIIGALPELIKAANDSDEKLRATGIKALGETVRVEDLGSLTGLLAKFKADDDRDVVQAALESACARISDKDACMKKIAPLMGKSEPPVKCALLPVLGVVGTPRALTVVTRNTTNEDAAVRDAAIRVLADWSEAPALPALLDVFRGTQDEKHRFVVLRGCVRLLDFDTRTAAEKVKIYSELMAGTQRTDDRKVILSGLANVADAGALKLIEPLLEDAEVKAEAKLASDKISAALKKVQAKAKT